MTFKDKDLDKDCILVLKESLRTRTRTNITGVTSPGGYRQTTASCLGQLDLGLCVCCVVATLTYGHSAGSTYFGAISTYQSRCLHFIFIFIFI